MVATNKLSKYCSNYEELATELLEKTAKKKKKKLDPKAKVRNRGTVVFPAESSSVKDNKDHFPINDEDQARNAYARAHQYSKAPSWYKGSLKSLQDAVKSKVHKKYPSIEFADKKKKSSLLDLANQLTIKFADAQPQHFEQTPYPENMGSLELADSERMPTSMNFEHPSAHQYSFVPTYVQEYLNSRGMSEPYLKLDSKLGPLTRAALDRLKRIDEQFRGLPDYEVFAKIAELTGHSADKSDLPTTPAGTIMSPTMEPHNTSEFQRNWFET
jgi:hypothetical protein